MISASSEFKEKIKNGGKFVNYADITLRDGTVLHLNPSDFSISGFSLTDETTTGGFEIGTAVGKTISLTLSNHTNKFSLYDFFKSTIFVYIATQLDDGRVLKVGKGKYYVINPTSPGDTITLSGVDSMYLFDKPYKASTVFPATLQAILSDCCLDCGVNIGFSQFPNYNFVVRNKPNEEFSYRDVVSFVGQIAGCNARISVNDALEFVWLDTTFMNLDGLSGGSFLKYNEKDTYFGGDFSNYDTNVLFHGGFFTDPAPVNVSKIKSLSVSTDDVVLTGVRIESEEKSVINGTEGYVILIKDNPLVVGRESEVANYLGGRLRGITFRPLEAVIPNNPLFESFDSCYIYDRKGNSYFALINSVSYKIGGYTTISCKADDPVINEMHYTSEAAKAVVQAKRNTKQEITTYDKAVQNMNLLAANSMGLYREQETQSDGSVIYYMSNKKIMKNAAGKCTFTSGSVVYKMTGSGFFVSKDGGKTFVSGFDSNGNAVVNVLSAIGITFDWAKGGTLTLGGSDNVNGRLSVLNSSGKEVGKWDKDGITLPPGTMISWSQGKGGTLTIGGSNNVNGRLSVLDSSGKEVGKWDKDGITLPPGTTISWSQVTGTSNVAQKNEIPTDTSQLTNGANFANISQIPTDTKQLTNGANFANVSQIPTNNSQLINGMGFTTRIDVNSIITEKVTASFINALNITAARVAAENITGTTISGKKISGGEISIGSLFSVDSKGNVVANSLSSTNAQITGGSINITTSSNNYSAISLEYESSKISLSPIILRMSNLSNSASLSPDQLTMAYGTNQSYLTHESLIISGAAGVTKIDCQNSSLSGKVFINGDATVGNYYSNVGFFGASGSYKKNVYTMSYSTSTTAAEVAIKVNEIITTLSSYNLI